MVPQLRGTRILRTRWMGLRSRFPWTRLLWRTRILRRWTRLLPRRLRWRLCPQLVPRWLRARWFQCSCPRRWRRIPQWRWPWRRTPIIVAQTCRERDEPGWLPTRPAAFGCATNFVLVSFPRTPGRSSAFSALHWLFLPWVNQKAGVPAEVRNRQKAPVRDHRRHLSDADSRALHSICLLCATRLFFLLQYPVQ